MKHLFSAVLTAMTLFNVQVFAADPPGDKSQKAALDGTFNDQALPHPTGVWVSEEHLMLGILPVGKKPSPGPYKISISVSANKPQYPMTLVKEVVSAMTFDEAEGAALADMMSKGYIHCQVVGMHFVN